MRLSFRPLALAAAAACLATPAAHAIDVDAGDYTALPAGTNLAIVYYQDATRDKFYAADQQVPINARLDSRIGILRGVHFTDIGGYIVDPQFLLPFGSLKAKGDLAPVLGAESGVGDLILAATVWLTKPGDKTHFGITPFLSLPTGDYDRSRGLNLGENRWKFTLGFGVITPLADRLLLDLAGDVTIFGKNDDASDGGGGRTDLKQKPLSQWQGHLRYQIDPTLDLRAGLSWTTGGKTKLGGAEQDDRQSTTKMNLGAAWFVRPTTQLLATWGRDLDVRQGPKENSRINLRLLQVF